MTDVIIPRKGVASIQMLLSLWDADPTTGPAQDTISFSHETKTPPVDGLTVSDLLNRVRTDIVLDAQSLINDYQYSNTLQTHTKVIELISDIDGTLVS